MQKGKAAENARVDASCGRGMIAEQQRRGRQAIRRSRLEACDRERADDGRCQGTRLDGPAEDPDGDRLGRGGGATDIDAALDGPVFREKRTDACTPANGSAVERVGRRVA